MTSRKLFPFAIVIAALLAIAVGGALVSAETSFSRDTQTDSYQYSSLLSATTTTATSTNLTGGGGYALIGGAKQVAVYFSRGGATGPNTGSTKFNVQVTPDGTNWYDYNTLQLNLASSTYPTTVRDVTISAATTTVITYLRDPAFYGLRCIAIETTDGDHTCAAAATF